MESILAAVLMEQVAVVVINAVNQKSAVVVTDVV
tara:strand:- start:491 stop:592 length:102 start_codon:yes stop_codon:yes gene_type:complete